MSTPHHLQTPSVTCKQNKTISYKTEKCKVGLYRISAFPPEGVGHFGVAWWSSEGAVRRSSVTARVSTADSTLMALFKRRVPFGSVRLSPVGRGQYSPAQFRGRVSTTDSTLMVGRMSIAAAAT